MTDLILIISRCMGRAKKVKSNEVFYKFHFKGFYAGECIKSVWINPNINLDFERDSEYLLWVRKITVQNGVLKVEHIKSQKIV